MEFPIITRLGGASEAQKKLADAAYTITLPGISMWKKRGIPGPAMVALMAIAEAEGLYVSSSDFKLQGRPDPKDTGLKRLAATR